MEVPLTENDIINILQKYKPAAQKVFRGKVNLWFDRKAKEIQFEIPAMGTFYDKDIVYKQLNYKILGLDKLIPYVYTLKLVDEWIEKLSPRQAEAIFWRYINHDFEISLDKMDWRIKYKTLSYEEIARRMGSDVKNVWLGVKRALKKITDFSNS